MMSTLPSEEEIFSVRRLMEHPTKGWQRVAMRLTTPIFRGKEQIPDFAGKTIRTADAYVLMSGRKAVELKYLELSDLVFDHNGYVDQDVAIGRIVAKRHSKIGSRNIYAASQIPAELLKAVLPLLGLSKSS